MIKHLVPICLFAASLSACETLPRVVDAPSAIEVAQRTCSPYMARVGDPTARRVEPSDWQARQEGDHWFAWVGDPARPRVSMDVPRGSLVRHRSGEVNCRFS